MIKARIFIFAGNIHVGDTLGEHKFITYGICQQNLSPTSIYGFKMKKILWKKLFILEVHKENRAYRETNFTWADFWYKLIISAGNKICHQNLVATILSSKSRLGAKIGLRSFYGEWMYSSAIFLSNSQRVQKSHFVSKVHQSKTSCDKKDSNIMWL